MPCGLGEDNVTSRVKTWEQVAGVGLRIDAAVNRRKSSR